MKRKVAYWVLFVILMGMFYLFSNNYLCYYSPNIMEVYSLDVKKYAELSQGDTVSQIINIDENSAVLLKKVSAIVVNVVEKDGGIGVRLKKNGQIIAERQKEFNEINIGEWFDINISEKIYPRQDYELEWYSFSTKNVPYLLILDESQGAPCNEEMKINEIVHSGTLAINYEYEKIIPFSAKVQVFIVLFIIFFVLAAICFEADVINNKIQVGIATVLIFAISILPIVILGKYNRPSADDFSYSASVFTTISQGGDIFDVLKSALLQDINTWFTWQGLYVSAFFAALQPGVFGEKYYALTTIILLAIMGSALYISLRIVRKRLVGNTKLSGFYSLLFVGIIVAGMPSALEGLYWYNGAMNYLPFVFLVILNMSLIVEFFFKEKVRWIVLSIVLSFVISGGNHVTSFLNILLLTLIAIGCSFRKRYAIWSTWVSAVVGFALMYMAPGTKVRADLFEKHSVIETIMESSIHAVMELGSWVNLQLFCIILTLLPFMYKVVLHNKFKKVFFHPLYLVSITMVILIGLFCVPYYAVGYFGAGRLKNVIWVSFIFFILINISYLLCWINNKYISFVDNENIMTFGKKIYRKYGLVLVICCCMFGNFGKYSVSNSFEAMDEVMTTGEAMQYAEEMDARYYELKNSDKELIYFDELTCEPELLLFSDIGKDCNEWPNWAVTQYYGKMVSLFK